MNYWDVSAVTDFSDLFIEQNTFNEPIGNWDVSSGTKFVSNDQSVGLKRSLVLLCFQLGSLIMMCGVS
jgi:hypothetical protein